MKVGPENYLLRRGSYDNDSYMCIAFQRSEGDYKQTTILGDLILHDKIFVYNLKKMQIGWVNYNCSLLSTTTAFAVSGSSSYCSSLIVSIWVAVVSTSIMARRHFDGYY
ncbi:hypothetical protein BRADI_5g18555v3 [Brachypodium distachyon]|uniref:Peptidase A1 domain-containing protein n=1 Tax=Brachypodium distachyon TaxID=15368 RepID=A0A0Q3GSU3_BRADI|nr:hypothetical protein BRADI_5g18555v3 [Brachypodium distachyon]